MIFDCIGLSDYDMIVRQDTTSLNLFSRYYFGRCAALRLMRVPKDKIFLRGTRRT